MVAKVVGSSGVDKVQDYTPGTIPVGSLIDFAGNTAPVNYLACPKVQTNVSRATYAALFAAIGTAWGTGDGATTFGIPYFPLNYTAVQADGNVGTASVGQVISHNHTSTTQGTPGSFGGGSLSTTAPTLPAGYTHKARVGWIRTDGTANKYPLGFTQKSKVVQYLVAAGSNVAALRAMASGNAGSVSVPTWAAIATGSFIPSTAVKIRINCVVSALGETAADAILAPNNSYGPIGSTTNPPFATVEQSWGSGKGSWNGEMCLESSNIYWAAGNFTSSIISCIGWEDSL